MANTNSTLINIERSRAGAMACTEALRTIGNIASSCKLDHSMDGWWRGEDNAVEVTLQAAGRPDGFMAGFIAVFAEYVKTSHGGTPNLDKWKPEATMTDEEKAASRIRFEEEVEETVKGFEVTEDAKELAYQNASEQARKSIGELFTSAEDFKKRSARNVAKIIPILVVPDGGYSFEKNTAEKIDHSIAALTETIKGGDVAFSPEIYEQWRNNLVAEAFEKYRHIWHGEPEMNACIQRFMAESQTLAANDAEAAHV